MSKVKLPTLERCLVKVSEGTATELEKFIANYAESIVVFEALGQVRNCSPEDRAENFLKALQEVLEVQRLQFMIPTLEKALSDGKKLIVKKYGFDTGQFHAVLKPGYGTLEAYNALGDTLQQSLQRLESFTNCNTPRPAGIEKQCMRCKEIEASGGSTEAEQRCPFLGFVKCENAGMGGCIGWRPPHRGAENV